jgi:Glycosyltransferase sugar-binding region containing DXD motif
MLAIKLSTGSCSQIENEMSELFTVNCLWVGEKLRAAEQICLLSMLRQRHKVRLFTYERLDDVPAGIEVVDANEIIPREKFLRHAKTNSPALGANIFRYKLLKQDLGIWLDTDVILLKPLNRRASHVFGFEDHILINNAVLYIPAHSKLLDDLLDYVCSVHPVPPFYPFRKRMQLRLRKLEGAPIGVEEMEWGVFGPDALTHFVKKNDLVSLASAPEVFYPVRPEQAHSLFSERHDVSHLIEPTTLAVHLWNELLRRPSAIRPDNPKGKLIVDKGSFVAEFARKELGFRLESE